MKRWQAVLLVVLLVLAAFGVGYGSLFGRVNAMEARVTELEREVTFQEIGLMLATATIEAQRGSFEPARRQASAFFTGLQQNIDRAPAEVTPELQSILAQRDAIITSLSRAESAAIDTLADAFVRYRLTWEAVHEEAEEPATPATPAAPAPAAETEPTGRG